MAGSQVDDYATELLKSLAGLIAPLQLTELVDAAHELSDVLNKPSGMFPIAELNHARGRWDDALDAVSGHLAEALLGVLAGIPGVAELAENLAAVKTEGIHGSLDLGPVHLEVISATLVIQPPNPSDDGPQPPITVGPYPIGEIGASLASPFGGGDGMPGGGSIVRLPSGPDNPGGGYGGTLQLPLGPVQVSAAAVLSMIAGQPSFLAILGATFFPPVQLSFGFSLDRVGGIVGVNRRVDTDALRAAVRTGTAGDVLFAARPPASALALVSAADRLFPANRGTHLVGPALKVSWLSFGEAGSLVGLDLAVIVEIPTGKTVILGVARVAIPGLPFLFNLRLDILGIIDPVEQLISVDASLVDSHVLGIFEVYGDAAFRFSWGSQAYVVASVGGFYPGFNPEPAKIPPLRRVGLAMDLPVPIIEIRAEGYFAITSNSIQFGGRLDVTIKLGIEAHGFVQMDAIVQFRPFHFEARVAAGFDVSVGGFSFASVTLEGTISGPGPIVIRGSLSIDVFLFSIDWDETFTLGSGPNDALPTPKSLLEVLAEEFTKPENVQAQSIADPQVVLDPRPTRKTVAAVPPTGTLQLHQRRAPLGLKIERVDGRPLAGQQGAVLTGTVGDVSERFSPGSYINLTDAEALNRPPFDVLAAGGVLSLPDPAQGSFKDKVDTRVVRQIVIKGGSQLSNIKGMLLDINHIAELTEAAGKPPALSSPAGLVTAIRETWTSTADGATHSSATAAHQAARYGGGIALASADAADPVSLVGVL